MNRFISISIAFLVLLSAHAQNAGEFYIHGKLAGLKKGVNATLIIQEKPLDFDAAQNNAEADAFEGGGDFSAVKIVDRTLANVTVAKDGVLELRGTIDRPQVVTLITNNLEIVNKQSKGKEDPERFKSVRWTYTPIFLDNSEYTIGTNKYELLTDYPITDDCIISGGEVQNDFNEYNLLLYRAGKKPYVHLDDQVQHQIDMDFIKSHPSSVVSLYIANNILDESNVGADVLAILEQTITSCPADPKRYDKFVEQLKKAKLTLSGNMVIDLELATPSGELCRLVDIIPHGKIVLVDFWASWCGICRASTPMVKELYNKYSREQFDVVSISCDTSLDRWKRAMEKDDMPWPQYVLTKQGYADFFANYQTSGVPFLLLVDSDGNIICTPSSPENTDTYLEKIIK